VKRILAVSFAFHFSLCVGQQRDLKFEHLTTANGLSHNTASFLFQDRTGFLWIGTIDGLNRYDGYTFKIFKHDPHDSNSISSNFVHTISESRDGALWIGTRDGGLNAFDPKTERFRHYRHEPTDSNSIGDDKVGYTVEDDRGIVWIGTDRGVTKFDRVRHRFTRYPPDPNNPRAISNNETTELLLEPNGDLWVGTQNGLNFFDHLVGTFTTYYPTPQSGISLGDNYVIRLLPNSRNELWAGTYRGALYLFDKSGGSFRKILPHDRRLPDLTSVNTTPQFLDSNEDLYLTTPSALELFDKKGSLLGHYDANPSNPSSLSGANVTSFVKDRMGTMWLSTWGSGVNKVAKRFQNFRTFRREENDPKSLSNSFVLSLLEDHAGALWVGTALGLDRVDRKTGVVRVLNTSDRNIWCLMEETDGTIWAGSQRGGIDVFSADGRRIRTFSLQNGTLPENNIRALLRDSKGRIWAGSQKHGLLQYEQEARIWKAEPLQGTDSLIWAIAESRSGMLWLGSYEGGFGKFNPTTNECTWYRYRNNDSTSLSSNDVRAVFETRDGEVWVGTYGGGLNRFEASTETFSHVTTADGLANDFVYGILEDSDGSLWISTNNGISKYNRRTRSFTNFTDRNGLQGNEFNTGAFFRARSGEMLFGGVNGYTRFFPEEIQVNPNKPPVALTSFKVFDKELKSDTSITYASRIELRYDQNFFSFEFAALDFTDPRRNQFAYQLEGFDPSWINSGTRRYASYTNLDPGDYRFRVRASNNDGVWNEAGTSVLLSIVPPFYLTDWFRTLAVVVVLGLVAGAARLATEQRFQRQIHELEKGRALQEERERISRDLHDNAGAQMASIISGLELAERYSKTSPTKTKRLMKSLASDARFGMGQLRETIWALQPNAMQLAGLVERVEAYGRRQTRYRTHRRVRVENAAPTTIALSPIQALNLFRISQEAITNALKYSRGKQIRVLFAQTNDTLVLSVEDEGKGDMSSGSELSGGHGVANMERRVQELNGTIAFSRNDRGGMTISVSIPI
jgi:ligand-binding sensor domain-containing protein/signal transduction histidine kinase